METIWSKNVAFFLCLMAASCLAGCSPDEARERMPVKGQVLLNGKPLNNAIIWFEPLEDGAGPSSATKIIDGKYEISDNGGVVVGQHQIQLFAYRANPNLAAAVEASGPPGPGGAPMATDGAPAEINVIPANYNLKTELKVSVEADKENVFDFDVEADWTAG